MRNAEFDKRKIDPKLKKDQSMAHGAGSTGHGAWGKRLRQLSGW